MMFTVVSLTGTFGTQVPATRAEEALRLSRPKPVYREECLLSQDGGDSWSLWTCYGNSWKQVTNTEILKSLNKSFGRIA